MLEKKVQAEKLNKSRNKGNHLILFVHGLAGSALGSWGQMLQALASDPDLQTHSFDCYAFPTTLIKLPFSGRTSGVRDIVNGLRTFLQLYHADKKIVTLVGHSLGGIVVRQYLLEECKAGRHIGELTALLYAVPNTGAAIAGIGNFFSFRHKHLKQLCSGSDFLEGLNIDWVGNSIEEKCRIEYVVGGQDQIVTPESASCFIGAKNVKTLIGYGHKAIIKPQGFLDDRYIVLKNFVLKKALIENDNIPCFAEVDPAILNSKEITAATRPPDVLFDIYSKRNEKYYVHRKVDALLAKVSAEANIWISGPSGMGKTAALKRLVEISNWNLCHVMLGSYQNLSPGQLIREVCLELYDRAGLTGALIARDSSISDLLPFFRKAISTLNLTGSIAIFIEEIPLSAGPDFSEFLKCVYHLALEVDKGQLQEKVIWLYSSINSPKSDIPNGLPKIHERVQFIAIDKWNNEELLKLVDMIESEFKLGISNDEKYNIITKSNGSPRFIKSVFRNYRNKYGESTSLNEAISLVESELG